MHKLAVLCLFFFCAIFFMIKIGRKRLATPFLLITTAPLSLLYYHISLIPIAVTPFRIVVVLATITLTISSIATNRHRCQLALVMFVSLLVSIYTFAYSRANPLYQAQATFTYLQVILFFYSIILVVVFVNSPRKLVFSLRCQVWMAVFLAFIGFVDFFLRIRYNYNIWSTISHYEIKNDYIAAIQMKGIFFQRITATFPDPNVFSYYLIFPLGIIVSSFFKKQGNAPLIDSAIIRVAMLSIVILTTISTLSRSGILLSFMMIIFIVYKSKSVSVRSIAASIAVVSVAIALLAGLTCLINTSYGIDALDIVQARFSPKEGGAFLGDERRLRAMAGLDAFSKNIISGVGLGNIGEYLKKHSAKNDILTSHILYLDILAATGIFGFIVFSSLVVWILLRIKNEYRYFCSPFLDAILATIIALLASQTVYSTLFHPAFGVQVGLIIVYPSLSNYRKWPQTCRHQNLNP